MFYVKEMIKGVTERIEITDENVYNYCPKCGREIKVNLEEALSDGGDLFGTSVMCKECSEIYKEISNKAFNLAKETRDMVLTGEDLDVVETILSEDIEKLVMNYWNEVLHRESMIEEEM